MCPIVCAPSASCPWPLSFACLPSLSLGLPLTFCHVSPRVTLSTRYCFFHATTCLSLRSHPCLLCPSLEWFVVPSIFLWKKKTKWAIPWFVTNQKFTNVSTLFHVLLHEHRTTNEWHIGTQGHKDRKHRRHRGVRNVRPAAGTEVNPLSCVSPATSANQILRNHSYVCLAHHTSVHEHGGGANCHDHLFWQLALRLWFHEARHVGAAEFWFQHRRRDRCSRENLGNVCL